jgi:oligopeptide/dipeptide ABC transporter ATP-binding protein
MTNRHHSPLLDVRGLEIAIRGRGAERIAVANVDFEVGRGEVLGLVGESGSGKSLSMLAVMGLLPPMMRVSGSIRLGGKEILGLPERQMRALRGRRVAMVFQDPMTALNPVMTIGAQITEALMLHNARLSRRELKTRAIELMELVAIPAPEHRFSQFPHEFSGGMRQRVVIAIAVANDPELLIADEPTTALDVTIQAQIVEILDRLRREKGVAIVLITHDLGLVASLVDRVTILYAGRVAERGPIEAVFRHPRHPYTAGLLAAVPSIDTEVARLHAIEGAPPSISARPPGCQFNPRCAFTRPVCIERDPDFQWFGETMVACHRAADIDTLAETGKNG